jgi:hypothetical protein
MKNFILRLVLLAALPAMAQQETNSNKVVFQSINQLGLMVGETGNEFQIQTINGIKMKTFFAGIGVGIDEYQMRSVPLFLDLRKEWKLTGKTPFVYADAGMHFIWDNSKSEMVSYDQPGLFYDLGIGYRIPVQSNAFLLSAGYSFKSYTSKYPQYYYWMWNSNPEQYQTNEYELRRISVKLGFSF